jgi:hypothetical protein
MYQQNAEKGVGSLSTPPAEFAFMIPWVLAIHTFFMPRGF